MTDEPKKKLSLTKPEQDAATPANAGDAPRRKPPVRGPGTAPRKRMTAAEAAQAREEAALREQALRAEAAARAQQPEPQRSRAPRSDERGHAGPRDDRRPSAAARDAQAPRHPGGHDRSARGPDDHRQRPDERAPRRDDRAPSARDARSGGSDIRRRDDRAPLARDPRDRHPQQDTRGPHRQGEAYEQRPPSRRDDRRADGRTYDRPSQAASAQPPAPPREEDGRIRLSKLMSEKGLASRREADEWIEHGWVRVDGEVVSELGSRVFPHQVITIDPAARTQQAQRVTILIHKPIGYVSGQAEDGYEPAIALVRPENRWKEDRLPIQLTRGHLRNLAPAGRLDIDSTGLLVLTQDGRIAKHLIGEDSGVEKEYLVRVESEHQPEAENVSSVVPPEVLEALRFGLELDGRQLKPAQVSWQNEQQLRFVLREGRKRQIRRMCELVGLKVIGLKRVRMGSITLSKLPVGQWRFLRPDERF